MILYLCPDHDRQITPTSSEPYFGWECPAGHLLTHMQRRRVWVEPLPEECSQCGKPADLSVPGLIVSCADCHAAHPQWSNA